MLKKIFGKGSPDSSKELSTDDLVVLERYDEAIERLEKRAQDNPKDLHAHLRLAEVLAQVGRGARALDQFLYVADMYTEDGFYDKALALLTKVSRLTPNDDSVRLKAAHIQRLKDLEHSRAVAIETLIAQQKDQSPLARTSPIEVEKIWQELSVTSITHRLPGDLLRRLFLGCEIVQVERGTPIASVGDREEFVLIVVNGSIEARLTAPNGHSYQLRTFFAGDVFGERSLFEHQPWTAEYKTLERTKYLKIGKAGLERILLGHPDPRTLLAALRAQGNDTIVANAAAQVSALPSP